jgi:hypothetical protein
LFSHIIMVNQTGGRSRRSRRSRKGRTGGRKNTRGRINRKRKTVKRSIRRRSKKMSGGIDPFLPAAGVLGAVAYAMPGRDRWHGSKIGPLRESAGTDEDGNALPIPGPPKNRSKGTILNVFTECLGMRKNDATALVEKLWGPTGSRRQFNIRSLEELKDMTQEAFNTGIGLTDYEKYILSRLHGHGQGPISGELGKWAVDWMHTNPLKWNRFYQMYGPVDDACDWRNVF